VLRGYSGYNTAWALHLLAKVFQEGMRPPALVTIFFGANDAALKGRIKQVSCNVMEWYCVTFRTIHHLIGAADTGFHCLQWCHASLDP